MPTSLAAPPQTRPPHIPRDWWYRATWHARQRAVDAHNRNTRATEETTRAEDARIATLRANVENERRIHIARYGNVFANTPPLPVTDDELDTASIVETVETLLDSGIDVHTIASKIGFNIGALDMRLRRAGRTDLAKPFNRERNRMRRKPCPSCGEPIQAASKSCRACMSRSQMRSAA